MAVTTSASEREASDKKTPAVKKPKVLSPEKLLEAAVKNVFLQPFARRLRFLYLCMDSYTKGNFVMVTDDEDETVKPGNSDQAIGLIKVKNVEILSRLVTFFKHFGIDASSKMYVDIPGLAAFCSKVKWDVTKLTHTTDAFGNLLVGVADDPESAKVIGISYTDIFTTILLGRQILPYVDILEHPENTFSYPLSFTEQDNVAVVAIPQEQYADSPIGGSFQGKITFLSTRGVDMIDTRKLEGGNPLFIGYRFARISDSSIRFAHVADFGDYTFLEARPDVFLVSVKLIIT